MHKKMIARMPDLIPAVALLFGGLAACRTEVFSQALRTAVTGLAEPADLAFSW
jgi:hypothetical protein